MSITLLAALGGVANAAPPLSDDQIEVVRPEGQNDKAVTTKLPWCGGKFTFAGEKWETGRLRRAIGSRGNLTYWADAAERICEYANDPQWVKQATYLVQHWMNNQSNSQAEAEAQIKEYIAKLKVDRANEGREPTDEERFAFPAGALAPIAPEDGAFTAKVVGKPAWCDKAVITEKWEPRRIGRTVESKYGTEGTIQGALHICQRPTDPTWIAAATTILQKWMNWTHLSQVDAEKSLRARIQIAKMEADQVALCKGLEISPEDGGEAKVFGKAQRTFFGCDSKQPLWMDRSTTSQDVAFYFDAVPQPTEVLRLYWLLDFGSTPWTEDPMPSKDASHNRPLLYYTIAQNDYARIDMAALDKELSAAPYNDYARVVALETAGILKAEHKAYEAILDKMTKGDPDYTAILRDAPKKALAQWAKMSTDWKPELERSNAFEKLLSSPSRKVLKGCAPALHKDGEKLVKSYKLSTYGELVGKIAEDPIAGLLLSRLAVCDAADGVWGASGALKDLAERGRTVRGPRSLTYYTVLDAMAEAIKDRPRLLLPMTSFHYGSGSIAGAYSNDFDFSGAAPADVDQRASKGVIASVKPVADGVQIVFKKVKISWPDYNCVSITSHPLKIDSNGNIEYAQNCKATGTSSSQDVTPRPIVISPALNAAVKPGAFVVFAETGKRAKNGDSFGIVVYAKKSDKDKKLLSFFGFNL